MADLVESEIKLTASPAALEGLRAHPPLAGADEVTTLVTTYFDTLGGFLRRGGATLRIRDGGKVREQTLKLGSPDRPAVRRGEWNIPVSGDVPTPSGFPGKARSTLARLLDGAALEPVATTRIERTARRLHFGHSAIEIAFDQGTIEAGKRREPVCELEMELVEGHLADVLKLALGLPLGPELSWSVTSKAERCHALAFDLQPLAIRARAARLLPSMDVSRGLQAIAWNCLGQLLGNYPLLVASGDPDAVHQSRVALRRLRAAFNLFGNVAKDEEAFVLRAELKAVATGLGPARDLHVLLGQVETAARASDHDAGELLGHIRTRRDAATREAQTMLAAEPFQRLLFQLAGWIEGGEWLARKGETGGDRPLPPFAAQTLSRLRRKLRRANNRFADLTDAERHRLRIDVKKLRYAVEFFAPLYRGGPVGKRRQEFAKALMQLQDSLGTLNDMATASAGQDALFTGLEPITAAKLAAQLENLLETHGPSRRRLLKTAGQSLTRASDMPAWWKLK